MWQILVYLSLVLASQIRHVAALNGTNSFRGGEFQRCECDHYQGAVCVGMGIDTVPNDLCGNLIRLDLSNNKIGFLTYSSMMHYSRVESFIISHNQIQEVRDGTFRDNRDLMELNLRGNRISEMRPGVLYGLVQIARINLAGNLINKISDMSFHTNKALHHIDLSNNQLSELSSQAFEGSCQESLRVLDLSHNSFRHVPMEALRRLQSLSILHLSGNQLQSLEAPVFEEVGPSLQELHLAECGLHTIGPQSLYGLVNLHLLDISNNGLVAPPNTAFRHTTSLEILNIGGNKLTGITMEDYSSLTNLQNLTINSCKGHSFVLEPGMLYNNFNMKALNITKCLTFTHIDEGVSLPHLSQLQHVNFHGSRLENLPRSFLPFYDLNSLDLSECPLVCNCQLLWLKDLGLAKPDLMSNPRCRDFDGEAISIYVMEEMELECEEDDIDIVVVVVVTILCVALVVCALVVYMKRPWKTYIINRSFRKKKKKRLSANFTGKNSIQVIPNTSASGGETYIDLPGLEHAESEETEDNPLNHLYEEIPKPGLNCPDVKISDI